MRNVLAVETETGKCEYSISEEIEMSIAATNREEKKVELLFTNAQRYDFTIFKGEEEVWRWSDGRVFAMAIDSLVIRPGETLTFNEKWKPTSILPGEYKIVAVITSMPSYEACCMFKVVG